MLKSDNCYLVAIYTHTLRVSHRHSTRHPMSTHEFSFLKLDMSNQITPEHCISIENIINMTTIWNHSNVMLQYVCGIGILYMYLYIVYLCTPQFAYKSRRLRYLDHLLCASSLSCLVRGSCGLTSKITKGSNLFKFQRNTLTKLHLVNRRAGEGHLTHFFVCN